MSSWWGAVAGTLGVLILLLACCWWSFMSGRRYESGIWEAWLEERERQDAEALEARDEELRRRRVVSGRRGMTLRQVNFKSASDYPQQDNIR